MIKFFMMTSHVNCILVCNTGEMVKVHLRIHNFSEGCVWDTYLLKRMYWVYMVPRKDVLGYIASQRNVLGIGLKTYDCNYFYDDISYKLHACM